MRNVTLILDDGSRFSGKSFGYEKPVAGEVVFNTAMTGYPESLTDPSYAGQLMTLTYQGLCEMIRRKTGGTDGVYFTYTEEKPISFNPFFTDGAPIMEA